MRASVLDRTNEQITETVGKAARATTNFREAVHDRFDEAKAFARRGAHRAEELLDEGKTHIRRHPATAVTGTFLVGFGIGVLVGWSLRRK